MIGWTRALKTPRATKGRLSRTWLMILKGNSDWKLKNLLSTTTSSAIYTKILLVSAKTTANPPFRRTKSTK